MATSKMKAPNLLLLLLVTHVINSYSYVNDRSLIRSISRHRGGHAPIIEFNPEYEDQDDSYSEEDESDYDAYDDYSDSSDCFEEKTSDSLNKTLSKRSSFNKIFGLKYKRKHLLLIAIIVPLILYIVRVPVTLIALHVLDHPESIAKLLFLLQILSRTLMLHAPGSRVLGRTYIPPKVQHFMFECVNTRYLLDKEAIKRTMKSVDLDNGIIDGRRDGPIRSMLSTFLEETTEKKIVGKRKRESQNIKGLSECGNSTTSILIDLKPDQSFSDIDLLRDQISFILDVHRSNQNRNETILPLSEQTIEVIFNIESSGGMVQPYALAASHIKRLRNEDGVTVTVCIDQVAASGGYMCACQASPGQLFAAPFALVGSIGVVGQALNIHGILEKSGVRTLTFKSDEAKAPIGLLGEITDEGIEHVKVQFVEVYDAFKELVEVSRPNINIDDVSTGKVWLGQNALALGLIDRIVTSDEYISEKIRNGATIFKILRYRKPGLFSTYQSSKATPYALISTSVKQFVQAVKHELFSIFHPFLHCP